MMKYPEPLQRKDREQSRWWHCKIWKMMCNSGASMNNQWGIDRALELRWCKSPSGNNHLCSWSDRDHKIVEDYDKKRKAGKNILYTYDEGTNMIDWLKVDDKTDQAYKFTEDKYGNKTYHFRGKPK